MVNSKGLCQLQSYVPVLKICVWWNLLNKGDVARFAELSLPALSKHTQDNFSLQEDKYEILQLYVVP
jgi:hypothetical protein